MNQDICLDIYLIGILKSPYKAVFFCRPVNKLPLLKLLNAMWMRSLTILGFLVLLVTQGCKKKEDDAVSAGYSKGVFVLNEGSFSASGGVTWYDPSTGATEADLFSKANAGAVLGSYPQSMTQFNGKWYIPVTNSNQVIIVDAKSFQFIDSIGGLEKPRYFVPFDDSTGFVSEWGSDGISGKVVQINLANNTVVAKLPVGSGPDRMIFSLDGHDLLVLNSGGYGTDSTIAVLSGLPNLATANLSILTTGTNPGSLAYLYGDPYVLCKDSYLASTPMGCFDYLNKPGRCDFSAGVPAFSEDLVSDGLFLYFAAFDGVWRFNPAGSGILEHFIDQSAYSMNKDIVNGKIYVADAKGFTGAGELTIYSENGTKEKSIPTGVSPGEIYIVK